MSTTEQDYDLDINLDNEHLLEQQQKAQQKIGQTTEQLEKYISIHLAMQSANDDLISIDKAFYEDVQEYLSRQKPTARWMIRLEQFIHFRMERIINHCLRKSTDVEEKLSSDEKIFYNNLCIMKDEFEYGIFKKIKERVVQ